MDQILHILRKDIRRLRWEILGSVLLTLLMAWLNGDMRLTFPASRETRTLQQVRATLQLPVLLGWWLLILLAIQGEALPGIRQFWVTRPYRRGALLCAKLAFIALFVHAPSFLGDVITIVRAGLPLSGQWAALLWKQVLLGALLLVPVAAIAAVTTTLAQAMLGALGLVILNSLLAMIPGQGHGYNITPGMGWWGVLVHVGIVLLAAVLLFSWQYFQRATERSRILVVATNLTFLGVTAALSWPLLYGWQTRFASQPGAGAAYAVRPALERGRKAPEGSMRPDPDRALIVLPVSVTAPAGKEPLHDAASMWIEGSRAGTECGFDDRGAQPWIQCTMDREEFRSIRSRPVTIRGTVYATIFGRERKATVPLYRDPQAMPNFGNCGTADQGSNLYVWCQSVFPWRRWTRATLLDTASTKHSKPGTLSVAGYGPFHTDPGISPLRMERLDSAARRQRASGWPNSARWSRSIT